jgi:hypothetical protein
MSFLAAVAGFAARVVEYMLRVPGRLLAWYRRRRLVRWLLGRLEVLATRVRARPVALLGLVLAAFAFLTVLRELSGLLAEMHTPGAVSYGADALSRALRAPSVSHARTVLETWVGLGEALTRSAETVFFWYVVVDVAFIPVYATLLAVFLFWLRERLERELADEGLLERVVRRRLRRRGEADDEAAAAEERTRVIGLLRAYHQIVELSLLALPGLVLADVLEDAALLVLPQLDRTGTAFSAVYFVLWAGGTLKLVLGLLVVVPAVVAALSLRVIRGAGDAGSVFGSLVVVRGPLLLLVLFWAGLFLRDQSADVLRRWREDPVDGVAGAVLVLWLGGISLVLARDLIAASSTPQAPPTSLRTLGTIGFLLFLLALVGTRLWGVGIGLLVPSVILLVLAVLGRPVRYVRAERPRAAGGDAAVWLPRLIGGAAPVLLGLAVLRSAVAPIFYEAVGVTDVLLHIALLLAGVALIAAGLAITLAGERIEQVWRGHRSLLLRLTIAAALLLAWRVWDNPWRTSEWLGSIAVFAGFLVAASLVFYALALYAENVQPPYALSVLRFRRTPVFLLLVVWLLGAGALDKEGSYYDARIVEPASPAAASLERGALTAGSVFTDWADAEPGAGAKPLLFVSAAGGGIRAAYWTSVVLRCVLEGIGEEDACDNGGAAASERASGGAFFAASGISGGSLGLASYVAHLRHDPAPGWPERRLDDDYIAPAIAWAVYADLPLAFVRRRGGTDRDEVLERAFERSWAEQLSDQGLAGLVWRDGASTDGTPLAEGFFELWATRDSRGPIPLLLLNGTKVQDGCRFNVSVINAAVDGDARLRTPVDERLVEDCLALRLFEWRPRVDPESQIYVFPSRRDGFTLASTDDLQDFLCGPAEVAAGTGQSEDVRLSTAVMLSARFPFVMPSGRLTRCGREDVAPINLVDGGYFDTSGASPLVELWSEIAADVGRRNSAGACIVPVFIQIDTGYDDPTRATPSRPSEALVPPKAALAARNAREANARQAAALAFSGPIPPNQKAARPGVTEVDRFAHIYPRAHPGSKAPLGWTLSGTARRDLRGQLRYNRGEIAKVRRWFAGDLTCEERR